MKSMMIVKGFLAEATRPERFRRISETGIYNKNELVECSMRSNQADAIAVFTT